MLLRTIEIKNGDYYQDYKIFQCDSCLSEIEESFPHLKDGDRHWCWDCGFKENHLTDQEWLRNSGICLGGHKAAVVDGEIVVYKGKHPQDSEERNSGRYRTWRKKVLERDDYTCRHCGSKPSVLHAHHIKPFAKYKKYRHVVSNGLTLCECCHREIHKKR